MWALQKTYGYRPRALTSSAAGAPCLSDGLVFCEVRSRWTGRRLVSLPFSDYCDPLGENAAALAAGAKALAEQEGFRYVELRPGCGSDTAPAAGFGETQAFYRHFIDLTVGPDKLYRNLHKDSVARKVRRAEREQLTISRDSNAAAVAEFHHLFLLTRRRHGYPPPPVRWFVNMLDSLGPDIASLHLARKPDGEAVAGIVLLRHGSTVFYKYGASDERYHAIGGMPMLFWDAMREASETGFRTLDLGRTDLDGMGLSEFKERLGAERRKIRYWRSPVEKVRMAAAASTVNGNARRWWCRHLPDRFLAWAGARIYPHIG
jgi:CelD/BcsL family acetyltransferase involved in cellulose biosynthesis